MLYIPKWPLAENGEHVTESALDVVLSGDVQQRKRDVEEETVVQVILDIIQPEAG